MYAKALTATLVALALTGPASAHGWHYHYASRHHHAIHWGTLPKSPEWPHSTLFGPQWSWEQPQKEPRKYVSRTESPYRASLAGSGLASRPADCYGIPWCGCYMRHLLGVADRAFNLARNWAHWGHATSPHAGAVVVWSHHVGKIVEMVSATEAVVLSGNSGRGGVTQRPLRISNAIAFRE